jgi:hypothetical protein
MPLKDDGQAAGLPGLWYDPSGRPTEVEPAQIIAE